MKGASILCNAMSCRVAILVGAIAFYSLFQISGVVPALSDKAVDLLFQFRGPLEPRQDIVIVGIDEDTLSRIGAWPFERKNHAALLSRLKKAKVIAFDILFSESTDQDAVFTDALAASPPVIMAAAHNFQNQILYPSLSIQHYTGIGRIEIVLGVDGVVRKAGVLYSDEKFDFPSFSLAMLQAAGEKILAGFPSLSVLVNHYGPEGTFLYISYVDVLEGVYPEDFFENRYVLIGAEALGIGDSHITPFSRNYPTPGVEIQATILNNLLDDNWLRPVVWYPGAVMCIIALLSLLLWPSLSEKWNFVVNLFISGLVTVLAIFFFTNFLLLDPVRPLFFLVVTYLVHLIAERIWTARRIYREMNLVDQQLESRLANVYTNIPDRFFKKSLSGKAAGTREHLVNLQAGIKALSLQHHFIEHLLKEDLPPLILWDRESGDVILVNTMYRKFWEQYSISEATLPNIKDFVALLDVSQVGENAQHIDLAEISDSADGFGVDIGLRLGGRKRYFRVHIQSVCAEDISFEGVLAVLTDITEVKELEQLQREIVSVVSHELKLPLTVILGYGEILAETLQGTEKEYIDTICTQTLRLNRLIEDFLDIARLEHGHQEIRSLPLNLLELIEEVMAVVSVPAQKKSIELITHIPRRVSAVVGDYTLLVQAVVNLMDNAIKYSPEKTTVILELIEQEEQFVLCVTDQGPGIPEESCREIFGKFNRGQDVPPQDGFGLGLNFVQQVLQKHGGRVYLKHTSPDGSSFCLSLPQHDGVPVNQ